ncbi:MAG: 2-C-methyl-D-erythritol 4-phosphate cytidylyltransferase [Paraperlucidibaca sp.]|jgi:2-C-methyl-D-erythritol 4-phosphate cytidylyltransferase|uniref:2-C-methyl-D-erythritol 4-phosphate cytidylyltransferase n=1 Tax=Paraperlucidibaca sp. TaxID=2708021 RepID=UPI001B5ADDA8|nr:2-C-methyl-D-erythritol 4-phosphate cytidylyltransferase [Paraperlucidibaca sp.]|tara:strand:- start:5907 stop:6623 length:717 start_codon:yes stop_codon:yes gene_type:complete
MSAYFAVVPAAGIGTRFGGNQAKQYAILDGQPVIAHSLQRLLDLDEISHIALVLAAHDEQAALVSAVQNARVSRVAGGAERMDSVLAGLLSLKQARDEDWVLVHDVARPLLRPNDVRELINACAQDDVGGLLAHDVRDTMKQSRANSAELRVEATVPRAGLMHALTPQLFRYGLLRDALLAARADGVVVTDESAAIERLGHRPRLVLGARDNIKITYADDLALAAFYLSAQRAQGICS